MSLFFVPLLKDFTDSLVRYMPGGKLFQGFRTDSTEATNTYLFAKGLAPTLQTVTLFLNEYHNQIYPDTTVSFLEEWENALGIPDTCFTQTLLEASTYDERLDYMVAKLVSMNVQTVQDFQDLAGVFGLSATVYAGDDAPTPPPGSATDIRCTIVIDVAETLTFTYTFPIQFGGGVNQSLVECLFENLKPANCRVVSQNP